ncbi:antibiotic ABC transporter permease [Streptomyces sp. 3MP-14]|uniref:Antibiotic ABC transporter permease n=1 Tax=Streptomyces mimosae TaxID=2586635 RepID=A0A5N5ZV10_9ACTN|nr:antibiotic ABC transporter permease [Streptomyces mimosae]KAB8172767.1 antibiotic ABC transporter permease [Streptomyces sp. 3MP-14]
MRGYRALSRASARGVLTYRLSFTLSMLGVFFQFVAMLAVWRVLAAEGRTGLDWPQMRTYLFVAFACGALVGLYADLTMAFRIRSGLVAVDIVRPVRYQEARFAEVLGALWLEALIVAGVGVALAASGLGPLWPGPAGAVLFTASMLLMIVLKFLVLYLCGLACFWTQNYMGIQWARIAVVNLLSGALVPLALMPDWLGTLAGWSPFAGMASTPGLIAAGDATGGRALGLLAAQACWAVALWLLAKGLWRVALRSMTVNGG